MLAGFMRRTRQHNKTHLSQISWNKWLDFNSIHDFPRPLKVPKRINAFL